MRRGQRIADRFEILEHAGAGGMGTVYRALDTKTGRAVAVKLLTLDEDASAERFAREAQVLAQLSHPGIVGYVSHGSHEGKHYLVMEWVSGETLNRVLDREGLNLEQSVTLCIEVAQALQELHKHGLVHRDIKPSNLIFPEGRPHGVKVLDFGLARRARELTGPTRTGLMVGSPGYMSPEQARGQREVSPEADVFSLGCVFYECLTGYAAFEGSDPLSIRSKVLMVEPKPVNELNPEVPPGLPAFVQKMISKNITDRPRDGSEVARLLGAITPPKVSAKRRRLRNRLDAATAVLESAGLGGKPGVAGPRPPPLGKKITRSDAAQSPSEVAPGKEQVTAQFVILVGLEGEDNPPPDAVRSAVMTEGGTMEVLDSGQVLAVLSGNRTPQEEAARAARVALQVRANIPDVPITLVADCSASPDLGGLIERGVQAMHLESMESLFANVLSDAAEVGGIRLEGSVVTGKTLAAANS
nr:serine/threonine-protein kinase PknD [uncultured bacterium]